MRCVALLLAMGCVRVSETPPAPRPELWVDGSASEGGDGSREHPLKALQPRPGTLIHLATGLYPFTAPLPDGVELVGAKAVVLYAEGDAPAVIEAHDASLRELAIQGGQVGLIATGQVRLENVTFSGQRSAAVRVDKGGTLHAQGATIEGSVPETRGVVVAGTASISGAHFRGALRYGVEVTGQLSLLDSDSDGPATVVHVSQGDAACQRVHARRGRGPAFFAANGQLRLDDVDVVGHEYAVLTGAGAVLDAQHVKSDQAQYAAFGLVSSKSVVRVAQVTNPGEHGAIESLEGTTYAEDVTVTGAREQAVLVRHGVLEAVKLRIAGVSSGDAIIVRGATAKLRDVVISDVDGAGVVATAYATGEVDRLTCTRCQHGGLVVERGSKVNAAHLVVEAARESAVTIPEDGQLELDGLEVKGDGPAVWAECGAGSSVKLKGPLPKRELISGRCIEFDRSGR